MPNSNPTSTAATKTPHQLSSSSTANLNMTMKNTIGASSYDKGSTSSGAAAGTRGFY
jgi:hypothetical protein